MQRKYDEIQEKLQDITSKPRVYYVMGHLLDTALVGGAGVPLRSAMIFFTWPTKA